MHVPRVPSLIKSYGNQIKASSVVFRLRVYEILALLPPKIYEGESLCVGAYSPY